MNNQNPEQVVEQLPGEERGMPNVNETGPSTAKRGLIVITLLLVVCAAGGVGYWKYQRSAASVQDTEAQKALELKSAVPTRTFDLDPPAPAEAAPTLPGSAGGPLANGKPMPTLDKSSSSLMAGANQSRNGMTDTGGGSPVNGSAGETGGAPGNEAEFLTATHTPARKAGTLGNRNFILAKGGFIEDCVLQTRLDSTVQGMTSCVISRNVYSNNGKVLLVDRFSTAHGEYKGDIAQGSARIHILWTRIETPNGVVIALDSPGTDQLGGAGVPGHVDNHFWQRFGGALMMTLVDNVSRGLSSNALNSGSSQVTFTSGNATQSMAREILRNTINTPPTLTKNQGERVGIYIARDLDFSSVYDVAAD